MLRVLYTWKDVERVLLLNRKRWKDVVTGIEVYPDELIIYLSKVEDKEGAEDLLLTILDGKYNKQSGRIQYDISGTFLEVKFKVMEGLPEKNALVPLFRDAVYRESVYPDNFAKELPGVPVIAFHSYKGGVGRTLSLWAFVKAWSSLEDTDSSKRLLVVDADLEAPDITLLTSEYGESVLSFIDFLELIQEKDDLDEITDFAAEKMSQMTVKIKTEENTVKHLIMPVCRYTQQLLDMSSSSESLTSSLDKKYILAEALSELGKKANVGLVLVDLRSGLSEFSAPLLFDSRVKKFLVTSTSYQSVKGTEMLLQQICKGLSVSERTELPKILLTKGSDRIDTAGIISDLSAIYNDYSLADTNESASMTDGVVTELPFARELVHLESLNGIMEALNGKDFYTKMYGIVKTHYFPMLGK